jgi:hypothetical protein
MGVKRNPNDEAAAARRLSHSDHYKKPGVIGSMWQSWTKGTTQPASPPKQSAQPEPPRKQSIHRTGAGTLG